MKAPDTAPKCPRCDVEMEHGFVLDRAHHSADVQTWVNGKPEASFWGVKLSDRYQREVTTWRCPQCKRLESYAG